MTYETCQCFAAAMQMKFYGCVQRYVLVVTGVGTARFFSAVVVLQSVRLMQEDEGLQKPAGTMSLTSYIQETATSRPWNLIRNIRRFSIKSIQRFSIRNIQRFSIRNI